MNTYFRIVSLHPFLYSSTFIFSSLLFSLLSPFDRYQRSLPLSSFLCSYLDGCFHNFPSGNMCHLHYALYTSGEMAFRAPALSVHSSVSFRRPYSSFFSVLAEWSIKNRKILRFRVCAGSARCLQCTL